MIRGDAIKVGAIKGAVISKIPDRAVIIAADVPQEADPMAAGILGEISAGPSKSTSLSGWE